MTLAQIQTDWTINIGHIIWLITITGGLIGMYWNLRIRITKIELRISAQEISSDKCKVIQNDKFKEALKLVSQNYDKLDKKLNWTNEKVHDLHIEMVMKHGSKKDG